MAKVGRPTDLTDELLRNIKQSILDGNDLKTTAEKCFNYDGEFNNITEEERREELGNFTQKIYNWNHLNYLNLNDKIEGWKRDRKLMLADKNIDGILCLGVSDKEVLKVVADMSKFVKETLDKKNYSKQINNDITSDGKPLPILQYVQGSNSNQEDTKPEEEN
jgi:hypothetical protein